MKLWLLGARDDLPLDNDPWEPWYDKAFGFVVEAETEERARAFLAEQRDWLGDEVSKRGGGKREVNPWLSPEFSTCVELVPEGVERIVIRNFHSA